MDGCDHPAVFNIVSRESFEAALLVDALRVECGVKTFISIPEATIICFVHRLMVSRETAAYGGFVAMNNLVSLFRNGLVFDKYVRNVWTTHNFESIG